ncbi:MAG: hypothetical protein JW808_07955 [Victivallales bacterium]|nr:hypothetical protein [Victivallales bacterium]
MAATRTDGVVLLNDIGTIADDQWQWLGQQYQCVDLEPYVIMPNHIHALIGIVNPVGNGLDRSANTIDASSIDSKRVEPRPCTAHSLSTLVTAFKTTSSKAIHLAGHDQFRWQKSFHDSIVRNDRSLTRIIQYIADNPAQRSTDSENPKSNLSMHLTGASRPPEDGRPRYPVR